MWHGLTLGINCAGLVKHLGRQTNNLFCHKVTKTVSGLRGNITVETKLRTITTRAVALVWLTIMLTAAGCTATIESKPEVAKEIAQGEPLPASVTSFMGPDASKLAPGPEGGAALVYINPNVQWAKYTKIQLLPVEFWAGSDSTVSSEDQKTLTTYFYNALNTDLQKSFTVVDQPGPDTMALRVALMDATTATPGLRSLSVVVPQLKIINTAQSMVTGSYAFVGSAEAEMKLTDSANGELLVAALDKREGGGGIQAATSFKWGDAQNAMDYWANKITTRLVSLQGKTAAQN